MGRGAYDTVGPVKKKTPSKPSAGESKLDVMMDKERRRHDRWHYKFGFDGERASKTERAKEERRRNNFERESSERANEQERTKGRRQRNCFKKLIKTLLKPSNEASETIVRMEALSTLIVAFGFSLMAGVL